MDSFEAHQHKQPPSTKYHAPATQTLGMSTGVSYVSLIRLVLVHPGGPGAQGPVSVTRPGHEFNRKSAKRESLIQCAPYSTAQRSPITKLWYSQPSIQPNIQKQTTTNTSPKKTQQRTAQTNGDPAGVEKRIPTLPQHHAVPNPPLAACASQLAY